MPVRRSIIALTALALTLPFAARPQPKPASAADSAPPGGPFDRLHFRSIGPAVMSGRIDDFAVLERDPRIFYIAAATGGLWKTTNGGMSLTSVFDSSSMASIGAVTIPADDPNLVWVGTGENNNRQSSSWGDGVYKSTDGGKSWKNMGLRDSKQVARIVIDPVDHDVVYVAALGDLWKSGGERGIYKTTDGGVNWTRVLDAGPDAGGTALVMDPTNNKTLYAATYQRRRASWGMNGGGPASGIWKSTDAGRTWVKLTKGLPEGAMGRIGLDIFRRNTSILYARVEHPKQGGVYRSDDAGVTWTRQGGTNMRPMYFGIIRVDPENDLRIYSPATPLQVSDDGGKTFRSNGASTIHVDFHAMWIDPKNGDHMMIGGDGGVGITYDKGKKWMWLPHLPVGQFYHVGYDMQQPYHVCGGLQDNDAWCGPSATRSQYGIGNDSWVTVQGGDGLVSLIDPTNHRIVFSESQDGFMNRIDKVTLEAKSIRPEAPSTEKPYRWNWDTPMMLSHTDPATIYVGANKLFKSTDRGHTWTAISGDLTTALDRDTVELMGVKGKDITIAKNDGVEAYGALFSIAESRKKPGLIWTGSDDGLVHVTRDGGATWTNVTPRIAGAPRFAYVSKVEPSRVDEGTAYVSFDSHRTGDYGTYLYVTTDYGASFRSLAGGFPKGEVIRTVSEDQRNPDVLYAGTETGLWVSHDRGKGWTRVRANLPVVPVYEITQHSRDNAMILATHGRAIWILDDMTPLQTWTAAQTQAGWVFGSPGATLRLPASEQERGFQGDMLFLGENPPMAAPITYITKAKPDSVRIEITDASGAVIRQVKGDTAKAKRPALGLNVAHWDLRIEPLPEPKGGGTENPFGGGSNREGPLVLPGNYVATVFVNGKKIGGTDVVVRSDPESQVSAADRKANFDLMKELHGLNGRLQDAVAAARQVQTQLAAIRKELADSAKTPAAYRATLDSLTKQIEPLKKKFLLRDEGEEIQFSAELFRAVLPFKVGGLGGDLSGFLTGPTAQNLRTMDEVRREVPAAVDETNALVARFTAFVKQLSDVGIYPVMPKPVK
ncbi:MAG: glycosyl hydrolase [Gemmatimonadetes bacterium]|nr:glycosyl hydrolase [Gemmatimonadota bacterium]